MHRLARLALRITSEGGRAQYTRNINVMRDFVPRKLAVTPANFEPADGDEAEDTGEEKRGERGGGHRVDVSAT